MIAGALRWAADLLERPKPHQSPDYPFRCESALTAPDARERRNHDAASLIDDAVLGYVQLVVRDQGFHAKVVPNVEVSGSMWPALKETMVRLIVEGEREWGHEQSAG